MWVVVSPKSGFSVLSRPSSRTPYTRAHGTSRSARYCKSPCSSYMVTSRDTPPGSRSLRRRDRGCGSHSCLYSSRPHSSLPHLEVEGRSSRALCWCLRGGWLACLANKGCSYSAYTRASRLACGRTFGSDCTVAS